MTNVIVHHGVVLHGITLAPNASINNLQVEQLVEDPVFEENLNTGSQTDDNSTFDPQTKID